MVNACQSSLALTTERLLAGCSQQCTSSASDAANDSLEARASRRMARRWISRALELVQSDPRDHQALQALMVLHEKAERWGDAVSVGEALLRLKPADSELQKRVKKIASNARRR